MTECSSRTAVSQATRFKGTKQLVTVNDKRGRASLRESKSIQTTIRGGAAIPTCNPSNHAREHLRQMGFDASRVGNVDLLQDRHGNRLFRIQMGSSPYILKVFGDPAFAREVRCYALLQKLGVPTMRLCGETENSLLLEDLSNSDHLRLASEEDIARAEVGEAVAVWFRSLHQAGSNLLADGRPLPSFLWREIDQVTPETILELGRQAQSSNWDRWVHLANSIERIKDEAQSCDETLTYNDFHWTNLALTRNAAPIRAVLFDYHLLGVGLRYSDWRNVAGSLRSRARDAFIGAFGEVDEKERVLDRLLAPLHALVVALQRPKFPSWGRDSLELVETGQIHTRTEQVLDLM